RAKPLPPGAIETLIAAVSTPRSALPRTRSSMSSSVISTWETSTASMSSSRTWRRTSYIPFSLIWSLSIMSWRPRTCMGVLIRRVRWRWWGGRGPGRRDVDAGPQSERSGAGGELPLLLDALVELGEVLLGRVVHEVDLAAGPRRQLHAGGQADAIDSLGAVGDQRGAVVDVRREVGEDVDVLLAPGRLVGLLLDGVQRGGIHLAAEQLGHVLHCHLVAEAALVLRQAVDGDLVRLVDDDLALVEEQLEAVGADDVVGRGHEVAGDALAEVDERVDLVLGGDVALEAEGELREDLLRGAGEPLPQVQLVGSLVDEHAAALAAPGRAPLGLVVVALRAPPRGDDPGGVA